MQTLLKAPLLQKSTTGAPIYPPLRRLTQSLFQAPSALIVLSLALILTGTAWYFTRQSIENGARTRFARRALKTSKAIEDRLQAYIDSLLSARGLFAVNENITRADWKKYFESLQLQKRHPGIHDFAFARYVPGPQRAEFEKRVQNDRSLDQKGYPDFSIHPEGERPAYFPIEYIEPFSPTQKQFGFDIGSEPLRRSALEQARDTGEPVSTGRIVLITSGEAGFAIRAPIYRNGAPQTTTEERRRALIGVITVAFDMKDLMEGVFGNEIPRDFDFEIFDGGTEKTDDPVPLLTKERLLYDNDQTLDAGPQNDHSRYSRITSLEIAGRIWNIRFSTYPHFGLGKESDLPPLILFSGVTISLLLSYITWSTSTSRRRAISLAETTTADLRESEERFRAIFDRAPSGIGVVNLEGHFIQVNQGYTVVDDITDRKGADEKLRRSEAELAKAQRIAHLGSWSLDLTNRSISWSDELYRIYGLAPQSVALTYDIVSGYNHPEDREWINLIITKATDDLQPFGFDYRIIRSDGSVRVIHAEGEVLADETGRAVRMVGTAQDLAERKQAEDALRESQRALSTLMSNLPGMVYRCRNDRDWTIEFASEGCFHLTGYSPSDLIGNRNISYGALIHPDDREPVWNSVQAALQGKKPFQLVCRIRTASGEEKWVWEQGRGIFSSGGDLLALEGFVADITEHRRAEEELRRSEAKTRALLHAIPDMMFRIHRDGTYLDFKAAKDLEPLFPPEAFLGKKIEEIMPVAIAQQSHYHIDRALASGEMQIFEYALEVGGQMRHYEARLVVGGREEILAIIRDITERKRVEEALRKSEERFYLATRATNDAVWDWDLATDALWWNETFQTLFGHTAKEIEPRIESWTNHLHPDDKERVLSGVHAMIEGGGQFWSDEYRFRRGDGTYATVFDRGYVVRDPGRKPVRMIGAMMDITERKDAEEALRIKTEQLAAVSDAMTVYLDRRDWYESSAQLLRSALHQTQSEYGFIGVVVEGPRLRIIAHRGVDWDAVTNRSFYEEALQRYREHGYLDFDRLDNLFGEVIRTGKRVVANDVATDPRSGGVPPGHPPLHTFLGVPIIRENQVVGIIGVANRPGGYSGTEQDGIEILCYATGILYDSYRQREREIVLENHQRSVEKELRHSQEQLRNLSTHLHSMVEEERTRISREIHDELGQLLTILKMELSWLKKQLPKNEGALRERTKSMARLVDTTVQTLRKISTELRPGVLDDLGLTAAIEWQVQEFQSRTQLRCSLTVRPEEILLDPDRSTTIFRIFQETLTNIVRHANADEVTILLEKNEDCLILEVKDNGRGITQSQITNSKSLGLLGIRERALLWGGTVQISGLPGKGTTITVQIPLYQSIDIRKKS